MELVTILGKSGFIAKNIIAKHPEYFGVSLREIGWSENLPKDGVYINLVGKAHDHDGGSGMRDYVDANVEVVKNIFNVFVNSSATLLIHVSSIAAIEELESNDPLVENDHSNSLSWYGKTKRQAEEWLLSQSLPKDKKLVILRPPMVHGSGDKGNLGLLYKLILTGIPYPLASFENRRSFISITNFIYIIEEIINKRDKLEDVIYHIADDEVVSTQDIIDIISDVTGKNVKSISVPKFLIRFIAKLGDILPIVLNTKRLKKMTSNLVVSNSKIKKSLGIVNMPQSAKDGLKQTIQKMENLNASV